MADLDAADDFERALAVRRRVAGHHVADVGDDSGSRQSRPKLTPRRWKSGSLAPQMKSAMTATARSAMSGMPGGMPTGPR
jgi:hypothetical protein